MTNGYKWFISVLSVLWSITVAVDIYYMIALYGRYFVDLTKVQFPIFVIIPLPVGFYYQGVLVAFWFGLLIITFSVFFLYALVTGFIKLDKSAIFKITEFYALNLFLSIIYLLAVAAAGKPVISPFTGSTPFYETMLSLTNAGLYEELITRVLYIGIPLFLYYRMKSREFGNTTKKLPWYRMIWGGGYKFGKPEITVLIISSIIFGIAHSASWDLSKVPQAALGGFLLGILYLRYGLYADVLFHFSIDSTDAFLPSQFGNPLANGFTTSFDSIIDIIFLLAGAVVLASYLFRFRDYLSERKTGTGSGTEPDFPTCPRCQSKNSEVIYQGIYRCKNCGNVFKKI